MPDGDPRITPWKLNEQEFPADGPSEDQARFLLRYAVLAPSTYNTQPWSFAVTPAGVEVYADHRRQLQRIDPAGRELLISVGAALCNLRVAAAHFGLACTVRYFPHAAAPECVAAVALDRAVADAGLAPLFPAITKRCSNRALYPRRRIPQELLKRLEQPVEPSGVGIRLFVSRAMKQQLAQFIAEANHRQGKDGALRREVGQWLRSTWSLKEDGLPSEVFGLPLAVPWLGTWLARRMLFGIPRLVAEAGMAEDAAAVAVFESEDSPAAWLACGEALERFLLTLTLEGLQAAFIPQPAEVPAVRDALRRALGLAHWPQVILRIGYAPSPPLHTPRRALEHVLQPAAA